MSDQRSSVQVETVDAVTSDSRRRGLTYLSTLDERLDGRSFRIARPGGDREMIFFGSCSYLGLETHPALVEGARAAAASHGTQFSSSRAFVSVGLYDTLEDLFRQIFRGHEVVISATTTLGHLAALPVLARPDDAILLDQQVHASVQTAAQVAKGQGTRLTVLPHNQVAPLERKIKSWRARHGRLWLAVDGVYSMFGNVPHLDSLIELMDRYPELHLYIDDAHGMSWAGELGCGLTLHRLGRLSDRIVMATSLAKAFGCGGGVLVFGNPEWARLVRQCGGTLVFSGPIQPPVLGAAIASARLHASGEIHGYQRELQNKVRLADRELQTRGLPLLSTPGVPILFVPVGLPKGVYEILQRMMKDGFYLDAGVFPATPMKRGGVRLTITRHLTEGDIVRMAERLAHHHGEVLRASGGADPDRLERVFRLSAWPRQELDLGSIEGAAPTAPGAPEGAPRPSPKVGTLRLLETPAFGGAQRLQTQHARDIREIDRHTWNDALGDRGGFDWHGLLFQQSFFAERAAAPEHDRWQFHYFLVRDGAGRTVLATFATVALAKDDLFAPPDVSQKAEELRAEDPYALTSRVVMVGSMLSEGRHLFLDAEHPGRFEALDLLIERLGEISAEAGAGSIVLRDFDEQEDLLLRQPLLERGFTPLTLPDGYSLEIGAGWSDVETFARERFNAKRRWKLRREILDKAPLYTVEVTARPLDSERLRHLHGLYLNVRRGKLRLNTFELPVELLAAMGEDSRWEFLELFWKSGGPTLKSGAPASVAIAACYRGPSVYEMLLASLDYDYVAEGGCYRQLLHQTVQRANALGGGIARVNLGFTGDLAKRRVGASPSKTFAYVQLEEHLAQDLLRAL